MPQPKYISFFERYYELAHYSDINIIKNEIFNMYNTLVDINPVIDKVGIASGDELRTVFSVRDRAKVSKSLFETDFPYAFWLRFYFDLRLNESEVLISRQKYKEILSMAGQSLSSKGPFAAIQQIHSQIQKRVLARVNGPIHPHLDYTAGLSHHQKLAQYFS